MGVRLNSKLRLMNKTNTRIHRLAAGQALAAGGERTKALVLVEGEAMVQEPARWLGGSFVLRAARRVAGPAQLPVRASIVALGAATILAEEEQAGLLATLSSRLVRAFASNSRRGTAAAH